MMATSALCTDLVEEAKKIDAYFPDLGSTKARPSVGFSAIETHVNTRHRGKKGQRIGQAAKVAMLR